MRAEQLDRTGIGMDQSREQPHGRRLAGTIRPQEAVDDALRNRQIEAGQRDSGAIALVESVGGERKACCSGTHLPPLADLAAAFRQAGRRVPRGSVWKWWR